MYVFVDEFSFLSYEHLSDMSDQIRIGMGRNGDTKKEFGGMSMAFFGDYQQLPKPGSKGMYFGATGDDNVEQYFLTYTTAKDTKAKHEKMAKGRHIWRKINNVVQLIDQVRLVNTPDGNELRKVLMQLVSGNITAEWLGAINDKALTSEQARSREWRNQESTSTCTRSRQP